MKTPRVLVVDDTEWWVESVARSLQSQGFSVSSAPHGLAAIDRIDRDRPDIILLDLFLPGPNGVALLHELRSHTDLATIPVIVLSGAVTVELSEVLANYGISRTLDKASVTPAEITAALRKVLL